MPVLVYMYICIFSVVICNLGFVQAQMHCRYRHFSKYIILHTVLQDDTTITQYETKRADYDFQELSLRNLYIKYLALKSKWLLDLNISTRQTFLLTPLICEISFTSSYLYKFS